MARRPKKLNNCEGVALLTALGLLFIFVALGTAYLRFATLRADETRLDLAQARSREAAAAGVRAAIGAIEVAAEAGTLDEVPSEMVFTFPVYSETDAGLIDDGRYQAVVTVSLEEESSKLNINHAPVSVLQHALGVDGETARALRAQLPAAGGDRWFVSVDDLLARDALSDAQRQAIEPDLLTVSTVADPHAPSAFLNINAVPPRILGAILDVPRDRADAIAEARPFRSLVDLVDVAGKDPETFNFRPDPDMPDTLPAELAVHPTAFRLTATSLLHWDDGRETNQRHVEAVAALESRTHVIITHWSEMRYEE